MRFTGILLVSFSLCFGANQYILDSELKTSYSDGGSSATFLTAYTYDSDGNRVQQRVWSGTDSITSPMSTIKYNNNSSGVITEAVYLVGSDTSSITRYIYNGEKLVAVRTLTKTGMLRFTDSLLYDESGRNVEEQRISSGVKTFFHRYTFNGQGKKTADSLYESSSGSYIATQTVLFTYNPDFTVASETQWRLSGNNWYIISTALMTYSSGSLVSVATHERDGAGTPMTDSLAYSYDTYGNQIQEEKFDETRFLKYRTVYTWRGLPTIIALTSGRILNDHQFSVSNKQGHLFVNCTSQKRGQIAIYNIAGKRLCMTVLDDRGIAVINGLYGKGSYVAIFTDGVKRQAINFTI